MTRYAQALGAGMSVTHRLIPAMFHAEVFTEVRS